MTNHGIIHPIFSAALLVIVSVGMFFACQTASDEPTKTIRASSYTVAPPVIIEAGKFVTRNIDTLPSPRVMKLSEQPPPVKTTAGFYVTMKNFNTEDGLPLSSILDSYMDKAGNLWFATSGNGVSKYDGKSFTNYSSAHGLIHNLINTITEDSEGNIWFGTYGGVSKYDGTIFENYTTEHGLSDNDVFEIFEDKKGNIWLGTSSGVSKYIPGGRDRGQTYFENYSTGNGFKEGSVIDIIEDRRGLLWMGGSIGLLKYNPVAEAKGINAFEDYTDSLGLQTNIIYTLTADRDGILWIGPQEFLARYDPTQKGTEEKALKQYTVADGLAGNFVISSLEDREGNLWLGTKVGVSRYDKDSDSFLNFTTEQGLADNQVESITEDKWGSLWFGTYGGGISKYDGSIVIEYSRKQGLPGKAIYATIEDKKGSLWFAPLDGGIVEYQRTGHGQMGGTYVNYSTAQGFAGKTAYTSAEDGQGNLWFGTAIGLCKYDGKSFTTYTKDQGLPDDYITALGIDKEDHLWIGTFNGGVSTFDGKSFTNFSTDQGLVHKTVWNFLEDNNGIIWIATRGGLSRFDGKVFMNFTTDQGLPNNKLSTVMQDAYGNILVGGWGDGVSIISNRYVEKLATQAAAQIKENIFEHFSTAEGLANDVVYGIIEDRNGNIVIGTSYGFTVINGGIGTEKIQKSKIENFNEKTGYPIKDVSNNYSMIEDKYGFIWAGTGDKLVRFDYSRVRKSSKAPHIFIQDIKINNELISWHSLEWARQNDDQVKKEGNDVPPHVIDELRVSGRRLTASERDTLASRFKNVRFEGIRPFSAIPENLVLPYGNNNITFDFIGVETARPHLVRYRYKLDGNDKEWSPVTAKATATFGNIFEGSYSFLVQAQSSDGVWSEPLRYRFTILPPWYRSWYAYLFYSLVFFGGAYSVHRVQKARTIRNEREKIQQRELEQARKIEKAYRELEIEAALERVRSKSIAMRDTSELQEIVNTVAQQLLKINININGGVFMVINDEVDRDVPIWGSGGAADYVNKAVVPFLDKPIFICLRDAIKERKDFFVEEYSNEEKVEFFEHLFNHHPWNSVSAERKKQLLSLPGGYTRSLTLSPHTSIFIINNTGNTFSDEDHNILKRFGKVFEQSYIRFLDLQKAEAQAREVLVQASLDRVRGEIASMRSTQDLQQIIPVIWRELTVLGIPFIRCGIFIFDEDHSTIRIYLSASDEHLLTIFNLSYRANPFTIDVVEHWKKGTVYIEHWDREDFVKWTQSMTEQGHIRDVKTYTGAEEPPESLHLHFIPSKQGMLYIGNKEPLTTDEIDLSKSLAEAFSIAYARYDDFNQLEQAKEKVEVALEELQATQQQLVQQEKLASLGQLTAGIAHEIKNPLNFVNNFSDVSIELVQEIRDEIRARQALTPKDGSGSLADDEENQGGATSYILGILSDIETNLRKIHEHGRRADRIVKSMLQHSRGGSGTMKHVNLNALVKEFVNLAFHGMRAGSNPMNVEIDLKLDENIVEVPLVAEDISRVMVNLCNNAFDAMRDKLSSRRQSEYLPKLTVKTSWEGDRIIIEIQDNGPGIPDNLKDKIMQPFFTTKKGTDGTGLGLYITNDIVKAHGGTLEIESELDTFTRFIINIPAHTS